VKHPNSLTPIPASLIAPAFQANQVKARKRRGLAGKLWNPDRRGLPWKHLYNILKVLIVDDSPVVRHSVRTLFESDPTFEIWGEAGNGQQAIQETEKLRPELVVMDLSMPVLNGLDAAGRIKRNKIGYSGNSLQRVQRYFANRGSPVSRVSALISKYDPAALITVARILARPAA
jgi:CheY-like chemotaxis protein